MGGSIPKIIPDNEGKFIVTTCFNPMVLISMEYEIFFKNLVSLIIASHSSLKSNNHFWAFPMEMVSGLISAKFSERILYIIRSLLTVFFKISMLLFKDTSYT